MGDQPIAEPPQVLHVSRDLDPVPPPERGRMTADDLITDLDHILDLDADRLPELSEGLPVAPHLGGCGANCPPLTEVARVVELEIWSGVLERGIPVASAPGIDCGADDLNVLPRLRLRSISALARP